MNNKEIGERIRALRTEQGISQNELADKVGLTSKTTICKIENGERCLTLKNLKPFADALGVNINYIMNGTESEEIASTNDLDAFGERIKKRRKELNLSQEQLAYMVGYTTKDSICKIEYGEINVPLDKILALSEALDISLSEMFGEDMYIDDYRHIMSIISKASPKELRQIRMFVDTFRKE